MLNFFTILCESKLLKIREVLLWLFLIEECFIQVWIKTSLCVAHQRQVFVVLNDTFL